MAVRRRRSRHRGTVELRLDETTQSLVRIAEASKGLEGGSVLKRNLGRNLRSVAKPFIAKQKAFVVSLPGMPSEIKKQVSRTPTLSVTYGKSTAGVRVRVRKDRVDKWPRNLNRGAIRHPLFGNENHWFPQKTKPGWFDKPLEQSRQEFKAAIEKTVKDIVEKWFG